MEMMDLAFLPIVWVMLVLGWQVFGPVDSLPAGGVNRGLGTYPGRPQDFRFYARLSMLSHATKINPLGAHLNPAPAYRSSQ